MEGQGNKVVTLYDDRIRLSLVGAL